MKAISIALVLAAGLLYGCNPPATHSTPSTTEPGNASVSSTSGNMMNLTDAQWEQRLTPEQYYILREQGTEPAFNNALFDNHATGTYVCAADGNVLFHSTEKYDSHTGWPSFWQPATKSSVILRPDADGSRTEVICAVCGGHLGHIFDDGPPPTGKRYCMNSAAMKFVPEK
jgi:peptide-methionine (R)-S-oxide reductase